jgi:ATP-binding cassette subfamily F protein uup
VALLTCRDLVVHVGDRALLDRSTLQIGSGERIGLVGRNGEGKSTLLEILAGARDPDSGEVVRPPGIRVSLLPQQVPEDKAESVHALIRSGFQKRPGAAHEVQRLCSILELDPDQSFMALSGGQKRKALLGRALAADPDLLLLDEPTNHLDLDGIRWLENFLMRFAGSLLFVTHDRTFLQRLSTRIVELDRGNLTSWDCDFPTFLRRKEAQLESEERHWALQDRKLAREEEWIRKGIKARRTRNEGRVRALQALRAERSQRRDRVGQVRMSIQESDRSGMRVIETKDLGFDFDGSPIVKDLSITVYRGDKVGIIGPNGCGKTTLLNLLVGNIRPGAGVVKHGLSLQISHFDQHRESLESTWTVAESVELGSDFLTIDGRKRHILSYLQDFLFSPERAREPVGSLSGGERNRLLLARLFARPANLLVLDEPTNDLDMETLELLEARLLEFQGTVLTVSHDRSFLDNLCSSTLVFEGGGRVKEYVGGYSDWWRIAEARNRDQAPALGKERRPRSTSRDEKTGKRFPARLTYREKEEWEGLPDRIEALEDELQELHGRMADPDFYQGDGEIVRETATRCDALKEAIDEAYRRWEDLESRTRTSGKT